MKSPLLIALATDEWINVNIVYDAILGWRMEKFGQNFSLIISEQIALKTIKYLYNLNFLYRQETNPIFQ